MVWNFGDAVADNLDLEHFIVGNQHGNDERDARFLENGIDSSRRLFRLVIDDVTAPPIGIFGDAGVLPDVPCGFIE